MLDTFVLLIFPAAMVAAALCDLGSMTIPNKLSAALAVLFVPCALLLGASLGMIGVHLATGFAVLLLGMALFAAGWIGGGDAKILAGIGLFVGPAALGPFLLIAGLVGAGVTILLLVFRRIPIPAGLHSQDWLLRLHDERQGVPYGVALGAAGLIVYPHTPLFALAA